MNDSQRIRLDWQKLLGFDQAELTAEELRDKPSAAALMAIRWQLMVPDQPIRNLIRSPIAGMSTAMAISTKT